MITLRNYQQSQIEHTINHLTNNQCGAIVSAVATGKTLVCTVVANELMRKKLVSKVIIAAPFNTIVREFPKYSGQNIIHYNGKKSFNIVNIKRPSNINTVAKFLNNSYSGLLSTSHQAIATSKIWDAVESSKDLSNILFIVDEAHHCFESDDEDNREGTILGQIANMIKDRNGKLLYATATPYRTYKKETKIIFNSEECNPVIRTIGDQMIDGYAPNLKTEYVHIKNMEIKNSGELGCFGDLQKSSIDNHQLDVIMPMFIKNWKKDGCPKSILLIPPGRSVMIAKLVKKYLNKIRLPRDVAKIRGRKNPSVLISVGKDYISTLDEDSDRIELDKNQGGRRYDIVIGCRRFNEGTDIPTASHMYMIGLPSTVRLFHQRTGRILRDKKFVRGYRQWFGERWIKESKVVLFAPVGGIINNFGYKVGRQLLHCIFAGEYYEQYCSTFDSSRNIQIRLKRKYDSCRKKSTKRNIAEAMSIISDIKLNEMKNYAYNEFDELIAESINGNETVLDRINKIKVLDISDKDRVSAYINLYNHLPDHVKSKIDWDEIVDRISKGKEENSSEGCKSGNKFKVEPSNILRCLEEPIRRYYKEQITSQTRKDVEKIFSKLTGKNIKYYADMCIRYTGEEGGLLSINKICDFIDKRKYYPRYTGDCYERKLNIKLSHLKRASANTEQGWHKSYQLLAEKRGYPELLNYTNLEEQGLICVKTICDFLDGKPIDGNIKKNTIINKIHTLRLSKSGKGSSVWFDSYQELATKLGHEDLFKTKNIESYGLDSISILCDFFDKNKRIPTKHRKDIYEKKLGLKFARMKKLKKQNKNWFDSYNELLHSRGYPLLFESSNYEILGLYQIEKLCNFIINHKRLPYSRDNSKTLGIKESSMRMWLYRFREAKTGKIGFKWFDSYQKLIEEKKCKGIFENKKLEYIID